MRIFVGIKIDDKSKKSIDEVLNDFKKIATPVKWVKPENIHLTLKFIGEISPEKYQQIEEILTENTVSIKSFNLQISGFGKFGQGDNINIIWAGIKRSENLDNLFTWIEESLSKIGIDKEKRKFKAHITLARNKKRFNFKPIINLIEKYSDQFVSQFQVESFQIYQSQLSNIGPTYQILKEIKLGTT
jgi:2'-5' RNA ligase